MLLRLCLSLLPLLVAGCAGEALVVSDSDWQKVPATERDAVERQLAADLASARAELAAATASLAELSRAQSTPAATPAASHAPTGAKPAANGEEPATAPHVQDQATLHAKAQVEAAKATWQHADLTWRQLRVDAANARLATMGYQRELARAQAVDHNLPGDDHYDVAPVRGQFSHAQQHWHSVDSAAAQARTAFEQASANLASAKEIYAQLIRGGPPPASAQTTAAAAEHAPLLPLPGWAITRGDIMRRHGLRHFLEAAASPQLHAVAIQLSAWRVVLPAATAGAAKPPAADLTPSGKPPAETPRAAAPTTAANTTGKASDHPPSPPVPAAASPGGKPATAASPGATPGATSTAKPADRPAAPASPAKPSSDNKLPI
jgi:hypothetical protein